MDTQEADRKLKDAQDLRFRIEKLNLLPPLPMKLTCPVILRKRMSENIRLRRGFPLLKQPDTFAMNSMTVWHKETGSTESPLGIIAMIAQNSS